MTKTKHVCCGQKPRIRIVEGKAVPQPHKCQDAQDVAGIDWAKVAESFGRFYKAQIAAQKERF